MAAARLFPQKEYADSKIAITKAMASPEITDWNMDSIIERDIRTSDEVFRILRSWEDAYNNDAANHSGQDSAPSAEQQAMIEEFKKKGWI